MKLMAIGTVYDERFTFSREIEPRLDLTDEEVIQFMVDCNSGALLDSVVLITVDGDEIFSAELIDQ
jgi:hypothetical protein